MWQHLCVFLIFHISLLLANKTSFCRFKSGKTLCVCPINPQSEDSARWFILLECWSVLLLLGDGGMLRFTRSDDVFKRQTSREELYPSWNILVQPFLSTVWFSSSLIHIFTILFVHIWLVIYLGFVIYFLAVVFRHMCRCFTIRFSFSVLF